jgi:hypothetical protein
MRLLPAAIDGLRRECSSREELLKDRSRTSVSKGSDRCDRSVSQPGIRGPSEVNFASGPLVKTHIGSRANNGTEDIMMMKRVDGMGRRAGRLYR